MLIIMLLLAVSSKVDRASENGAVEGEPANEAHTTAQPVSSEDMKVDCSNVTVPGALYSE